MTPDTARLTYIMYITMIVAISTKAKSSLGGSSMCVMHLQGGCAPDGGGGSPVITVSKEHAMSLTRSIKDAKITAEWLTSDCTADQDEERDRER